ncbi:hypothetical protein [Mycobacterium deserti]|uniref:Uncharacterized protein n=1 Tax=Mycobacterium deserti TaxID=2978347 RepID=A0ABT2M4V7_9MYCO|nr:hypothetical protein [Mycobacterium deserti]MCT7656981.1 hypothetical protein [Mycobacterium deserti]
MATYVRHTRPVQIDELPAHVRENLSAHAESRQLALGTARLWLTHSENPPAGSAFGRLVGRRLNPADPDAEHITVLVLHPTHLLVVTDGAKRGTAVLSLPLMQASVAAGTGLGPAFDRLADEPGGFTITGFAGEQPGSYFVGMGPEPEAVDCFEEVRSAIAAAKNPT